MSSTPYLRSLVITTPKDRKNSLRKELAKLPAWVETDILSFATPCVSYRGDTDSSACAQENLFLNHQKCAARLLSEDCNFGLILESDVVLIKEKSQHGFNRQWCGHVIIKSNLICYLSDAIQKRF